MKKKFLVPLLYYGIKKNKKPATEQTHTDSYEESNLQKFKLREKNLFIINLKKKRQERRAEKKNKQTPKEEK